MNAELDDSSSPPPLATASTGEVPWDAKLWPSRAAEWAYKGYMPLILATRNL